MKKIGKESSVIKQKTLFDHLNAITQYQDPLYWSKLSNESKKTWSNYMVMRFLSMELDFVDTIAELQPIAQALEPELLYRVLIGVLPKGKRYLKYMKGKSEDKYEPWLVDYMIHQFECSSTEAIDYLEILYGTDEGRKTIKRLCDMYGVEPKIVKKLKLDI